MLKWDESTLPLIKISLRTLAASSIIPPPMTAPAGRIFAAGPAQIDRNQPLKPLDFGEKIKAVAMRKLAALVNVSAHHFQIGRLQTRRIFHLAVYFTVTKRGFCPGEVPFSGNDC